jgi:integrase
MGIRKRGKAWLVTVELGMDERGVRRRKCVSCASEGDAKRVEANLTSEVLSGTYVEPSTATVAEFLDEWRSHAGRGRAQRTKDHYEITCEKHLKPALGRVKLAQLKPLHIENFMTAQVEQKGLAQATVDKHFWTLHKALDRAVAWGQIPRNPADQVVKPGVQDSEVRSFDVDEQAAILGRAAGTWQYGPILLALATGMRRGEIVALRWRDVELEAGVVAVRGSIQEASTGVEMGRAKTDASIRRIRIPEGVSGFLADHRAKQKVLARAVSTYKDQDLVFPREDGRMKRPSVVTGQFKRLCVALEIEDGHFHCLRHTFATEMLRAGVPVKVVSEMLGHKSIAITLRTYAHVLEDMQEAAAVQAGTLLDRALVIAG